MSTYEQAAAVALPTEVLVGTTATLPGIPAELDSGYLSILLEVDFTGREDIVYHSMMREAPLLGLKTKLGIMSDPGMDRFGFVYEISFLPGIEPVTITGHLNGQGVSVFQYVDRVWLTTAGPDFGKLDFGDQARPEAGQATPTVLIRNDFERWIQCIPEVEPFVPPTPRRTQH